MLPISSLYRAGRVFSTLLTHVLTSASFSSTPATEDEGGILHWWRNHPFVRVIDEATLTGRDLTILS